LQGAVQVKTGCAVPVGGGMMRMGNEGTRMGDSTFDMLHAVFGPGLAPATAVLLAVWLHTQVPLARVSQSIKNTVYSFGFYALILGFMPRM
jgi:hypothetical protein